MRRTQFTLVMACAASLLLAALAVTAICLVSEGDIPPLGSPKWQPLSGRLTLYFWGALAFATIFGLPAFLYVRAHKPVTLARCAGWGFAIGAVPLGVISILGTFGMTSASIGGVPTVINHIPTLFGLWNLTKTTILFGVGGCGGGIGFWTGLWATGALRHVNRIPNASDRVVIRTSAILAIVLACVTGVVHFIPAAAEDKSCHNMFRDGRRSISPALSMNLLVPQAQWRDVREFFQRFALIEKLSFQNGEDISGVGLPDSLSLDLCSDQGSNISVTVYNQLGSDNFSRKLPIQIYMVRSYPGWKMLAGVFVDALQARWPGKVEFLDSAGERTSRPQWLKERIDAR